MTPKEISQLIELINKLVSLPGMTWREKHELVRVRCGDDDLGNIREFAMWFTF